MNAATKRFLHRRNYRRRRLADAARLLPVFGLIALMIPLMLGPSGEEPVRTAYVGLYIVGIWAALIAVAFYLAPRLSEDSVRERFDAPDGEADK